MTPVEKNSLLDWLFYQYVRRRLHFRFHTVLIRGLSNLRDLPADRPVIAFSNHCNWWDVPLIFFLGRCASHKSFYCMMDDQQLRRYGLLNRIGAFGIDLENPLRAAGAVRYAVTALQKRTTLLWLFPQGEITPPQKMIAFHTGANYLATQSNGALMLPVAFRYEFFQESKPRILIEVGTPFLAMESSDERLVDTCAEVARRLEKVVALQNVNGFEELLGPYLTWRKRWEWLSLAVRGRLAEFKPREDSSAAAPQTEESMR